jgi:hypothetical protein
LLFNIREADISRTAGAFHGAVLSLVAQRQISLKKALAKCKCFFRGALQGTRTPDLLVRSQTLYPAELAAHGVCQTNSRCFRKLFLRQL